MVVPPAAPRRLRRSSRDCSCWAWAAAACPPAACRSWACAPWSVSIGFSNASLGAGAPRFKRGAWPQAAASGGVPVGQPGENASDMHDLVVVDGVTHARIDAFRHIAAQAAQDLGRLAHARQRNVKVDVAAADER